VKVTFNNFLPVYWASKAMVSLKVPVMAHPKVATLWKSHQRETLRFQAQCEWNSLTAGLNNLKSSLWFYFELTESFSIKPWFVSCISVAAESNDSVTLLTLRYDATIIPLHIGTNIWSLFLQSALFMWVVSDIPVHRQNFKLMLCIGFVWNNNVNYHSNVFQPSESNGYLNIAAPFAY